MNLIIFLPVFALSFVPGSENFYENIVVEPTNPFYKEQFQINQDDYQNLDDALGFGFWSQFRPYQEILASPYVDKEFQPSTNINSQLMFSIRIIDTNQFETVYYLYYPLFNDIVVHQLAQQNQNYCRFLYFYSFTNRYEGIWVYTHLQFIPLRSYINVNFITYASWQQKKVDFKIYKYGNKEIIIGGKGKILNFLNLEEFNGRMSRPIQFQKELLFQSYQFLDHYFQLHTPKSRASQIKIDIQKDLLYMDSKMQISQTVQMHENAYSFGGWIKVDFTNIHYSQGMPLIRGTINKDYQNFYFYGDRSFLIEYQIDTYRNVSTIKLETYSYKILQKGLIKVIFIFQIQNYALNVRLIVKYVIQKVNANSVKSNIILIPFCNSVYNLISDVQNVSLIQHQINRYAQIALKILLSNVDFIVNFVKKPLILLQEKYIPDVSNAQIIVNTQQVLMPKIVILIKLRILFMLFIIFK